MGIQAKVVVCGDTGKVVVRGDLFSVEQRLTAFAWASCCLLFIIPSGMSHFLKKYLPKYYHYYSSQCSNCTFS